MSKRYGRNQKRAHRAQISALTEAHERESKLAAHLGREVRSLRHEMEEWDDEIARLLGEYSAFRRQTPDRAMSAYKGEEEKGEQDWPWIVVWASGVNCFGRLWHKTYAQAVADEMNKRRS